jgi:hypothetical protein
VAHRRISNRYLYPLVKGGLTPLAGAASGPAPPRQRGGRIGCQLRGRREYATASSAFSANVPPGWAPGAKYAMPPSCAKATAFVRGDAWPRYAKAAKYLRLAAVGEEPVDALLPVERGETDGTHVLGREIVDPLPRVGDRAPPKVEPLDHRAQPAARR